MVTTHFSGQTISVLFLLFAVVFLFIGCKGAEATPTAATEPETTVQVTTEPLTETEPVTESVTETETETETEAVTEPVTEAATDTVEIAAGEEAAVPTTAASVVEDDGKSSVYAQKKAEGTYVDPLTGLVCEQAEAEERPVAIMLNNIGAALPQQGIASADILYECEVEGGLTRLLGIFNNYAALTGIGSVRSSREYYIDFAANHDAIYVHAGGSDSAYENLKARKTDHIDGVNGGSDTGYFYRDQYRRQTLGMALEHTLVIDGDKLHEAINARKFRTTYSDSFKNPMLFVGSEQKISLVNGTAATDITVKFAAHTTTFAFDETTNRYMRSQNGNIHIDGVTGEQLGFENLVVLFCPYTYTKDEKNHITVSDTGSGDGYYMTGGKAMPIRWSKADGDTAFTLTYTSGRRIVFTPGKTDFEIISGSSRLTIQ